MGNLCSIVSANLLHTLVCTTKSICGRVGTERSSMNWQDITELKKDGMDIESHSMTHTNLNELSPCNQKAIFQIASFSCLS